MPILADMDKRQPWVLKDWLQGASAECVAHEQLPALKARAPAGGATGRCSRRARFPRMSQELLPVATRSRRRRSSILHSTRGRARLPSARPVATTVSCAAAALDGAGLLATAREGDPCPWTSGDARARRQLAGLHAFLRCAGVPAPHGAAEPGVLEQAVPAAREGSDAHARHRLAADARTRVGSSPRDRRRPQRCRERGTAVAARTAKAIQGAARACGGVPVDRRAVRRAAPRARAVQKGGEAERRRQATPTPSGVAAAAQRAENSSVGCAKGSRCRRRPCRRSGFTSPRRLRRRQRRRHRATAQARGFAERDCEGPGERMVSGSASARQTPEDASRRAVVGRAGVAARVLSSRARQQRPSWMATAAAARPSLPSAASSFIRRTIGGTRGRPSSWGAPSDGARLGSSSWITAAGRRPPYGRRAWSGSTRFGARRRRRAREHGVLARPLRAVAAERRAPPSIADGAASTSPPPIRRRRRTHAPPPPPPPLPSSLSRMSSPAPTPASW